MTDIKERAQNAMHRAGSDELALLLRDCIERIEELEDWKQAAQVEADEVNRLKKRVEELEAAMRNAVQYLDRDNPISAATELESALGEDYRVADMGMSG